MTRKRIEALKDLTLDPRNANIGTHRGREIVRESVERFGAGRSVLADRNGVMIAGNKTLGAARELGLDAEVVETTGHELVVVQREDLDLEADERARLLAYADNRTQEIGLAWDPEQVRRDADQGLPLNVAFFADELKALTGSVAEAVKLGSHVGVAESELGGEVTRREARPTSLKASYEYHVVFDTVEQRARFARFTSRLRKESGEKRETGSLVVRHVGRVLEQRMEGA